MKALYILLMLFIAVPQQLLSQAEMNKSYAKGIPEFYYDYANVVSSEKGLSRLNLYIEVPYDEIQFLKQKNSYLAKYEVSVIIFDDDGEQVDGKIWEEEVEVSNFELTNSRKHFSLTQTHFNLPPDKYRIAIGLMDLDTKNATSRKSELRLRDFSKKKLNISDITLGEEIVTDTLESKNIRPITSYYVRAGGDKLYCSFEIYSQIKKGDNFDITYELLDQKEKILSSNNYVRKKDGFKTREIIELNKAQLSHGKYYININVKQGRKKANMIKVFVVRWRGVPSTVIDLEQAVEQLTFIATKKEMDIIKKAPKDERITKFKEFWLAHDPSPGTAANELMDEYYRRIDYSNENFSGFRDGWKSDMGMIYIIFGPPNDIERHPFDRENKPYEIWYYYHINRQFLFVDETGFNDYRLQNQYWRHWQDGIYFNY